DGERDTALGERDALEGEPRDALGGDVDGARGWVGLHVEGHDHLELGVGHEDAPPPGAAEGALCPRDARQQQRGERQRVPGREAASKHASLLPGGDQPARRPDASTHPYGPAAPCRRTSTSTRIEASSTTAVAMSWIAADRPSSAMPLTMAAITTPPSTACSGWPRPPNRLVPPMTAVATT